jgi:hypothetical protein
MKSIFKTGLALAACVGLGALAFGAIIVDDEGIGFVGKGDVQTLFGWNNHALQACATSTTHDGYNPATDAGCLRFEFVVDAITEEVNTWLCYHTTNPNAADQEQNNTATVTVSGGGISASVARARNQVNGFNLNGGEWTVSETATFEGHPTNHCQAANREYLEGSTETTVTDLGSIRVLRITDIRDGTYFDIELEDEVDE